MTTLKAQFRSETSAMLIERASWNDDKDVNALKNIGIETLWRDYIKDEDNAIYTTLDLIEYEGEFGKYGTVDELRNDFNEVRDTLWYSGVIQDVYEENNRLNLDECYDWLNDTITEMCPDCEEEVELDMVLKMQVCPNCGKPIAPCAICDHNRVNCSQCPIGCNR